MPRTIPAEIEKDSKDADLANGMLLFQERCMECHRYNASGEMAFGSPPLVGRQDWYLLAQLRKFKNLHRGSVKGDGKGAKMVQIATLFIEDEAAMKNVVSYILTLNPMLEEGSLFKAKDK
jgi:cytochrome c553